MATKIRVWFEMSWGPKSPMATKTRVVVIDDERRRRDGDMFDWQWPKGQRMAKPKKGVAIMIWQMIAA